MTETNYFLDFEFDETGSTINPISLGMVCDDDRELYLEFKFDEEDVRRNNPWVHENVVPLLMWPSERRMDLEAARIQIVSFVGPNPCFWGYFSSHDWVCLSRIFGKMITLPEYFPKHCMDLQQSFKMLGSPGGAKPPKPLNAHNALEDAKWNRQCFRNLRALWAERLAFKPNDEFRTGLQVILDLPSEATDQDIWEAASRARAAEAKDDQ